MNAITVAVIAFAVIFVGVGIARVVEFSDLGLPPSKRRILIGLHVAGCLLFASALITAQLDAKAREGNLAIILFITSLACLCPGQLTIGLKRKRALSPKEPARSPGASAS